MDRGVLAGQLQALVFRRFGVAEKFTNLAPLVAMLARPVPVALVADRLLDGATGTGIAARLGVLSFHDVVFERRLPA